MRGMGALIVAFAAAGLGPAMAQQRVVVVPAGAEVAVPARGAEGPRLVHAPRPRIAARPADGAPPAGARPMLESGSSLGGSGLAVPALIALPLAAIAAVAASYPGSGGSSTSAPARTR